jgi:phospholipase/carboxylesterase
MLHDTKRMPLAGGKPEYAVVLLHGLGDSGEGLIDLADVWAPELKDTVFLAPDAPAPCETSPFGYQWFSPRDWSPAVITPLIRKASVALNAYLDSVLETYGLPDEKLALVGFSQGTMMSLFLGPRRPKKLAGILGYSGALLGGDTLAAEKRSAPPVMLIHGERDDVIPIGAMLQADRGLQNVNLNVKSVPCPGLGHSIDHKGLNEGLIFLRRIFGKLS